MDMSSWLITVIGYFSKSRLVEVVTRPQSCQWCGKRLAFTRPSAQWWTNKYCSKECGDKGIHADIESDRRLDDAMDATHDRFEDID